MYAKTHHGGYFRKSGDLLAQKLSYSDEDPEREARERLSQIRNDFYCWGRVC